MVEMENQYNRTLLKNVKKDTQLDQEKGKDLSVNKTKRKYCSIYLIVIIFLLVALSICSYLLYTFLYEDATKVKDITEEKEKEIIIIDINNRTTPAPQQCKSTVKLEAKLSEHNLPWLVSINVDGIFRCVGWIIHKYYVLTTASCFIEYRRKIEEKRVSLDFNSFSVALSAVNKSNHSMTPCRYSIHPNFNTDSLEHNLAVIRLDKKLVWSRYIKPICLANDVTMIDQNDKDLKQFLVGTLKEGSGYRPAVLPINLATQQTNCSKTTSIQSDLCFTTDRRNTTITYGCFITQNNSITLLHGLVNHVTFKTNQTMFQLVNIGDNEEWIKKMII